GDIITHCYNGKPNRILTPEGELRASVTRALARGVRLDVGHGTNTMHKIAHIIESRCSLPFLHIADATGRAIARQGLHRVALLG
ncbi:hypothetical protein MJM59_33480, partial [Salmonella enterica subsp. enterica serovar Montevideo]|nr:hypothetical protein [Salmonella enterica subsp. enterica serovar Montevideo]